MAARGVYGKGSLVVVGAKISNSIPSVRRKIWSAFALSYLKTVVQSRGTVDGKPAGSV